jgi:aryl-alcohol dehydrogenase-like predicted oxidoreductase
MIEKRIFGRTGHNSTRTLFGAAALGRVTQADADRTFDLLQAYGINHIDTAASYGDAELRIGPWMENHRQEFFLATKTEKRTYKDAWEELQRSLDRLRTDHVDLWQMHFLLDPQEWETAMGPGGALEAFIEAREQGLARYLGVTGHGVNIATMHLRSLERFDFDSVLLPYSYTMMQNRAYAADFEALREVCRQRNVVIQTIKSLVRGPWGDKTQTRATWYEPLEDQKDIDLAVHWVLQQPDLFLNTAGDIHLLPKVLDAASRFQKGPSAAEMAALTNSSQLQPLFV